MNVPTTAEFWEIAHQVCTPRELEALGWKQAGYGYRRIGRILSISPEAARGRIQRAGDKIIVEHRRRQEAA